MGLRRRSGRRRPKASLLGDLKAGAAAPFLAPFQAEGGKEDLGLLGQVLLDAGKGTQFRVNCREEPHGGHEREHVSPLRPRPGRRRRTRLEPLAAQARSLRALLLDAWLVGLKRKPGSLPWHSLLPPPPPLPLHVQRPPIPQRTRWWFQARPNIDPGCFPSAALLGLEANKRSCPETPWAGLRFALSGEKRLAGFGTWGGKRARKCPGLFVFYLVRHWKNRLPPKSRADLKPVQRGGKKNSTVTTRRRPL